MRMEGQMEDTGGGGGQVTRSTHKAEGRGGQAPGSHLLGDQVIEQRDHTHGQYLHALLLDQTSQHLQPPQLQELLLGVGEVS